MDKFQSKFTRFGFISICFGSIALVLLISHCSTSFFDYSFQKFKFSFPEETELRRNVYTSSSGEENRVVVDSRHVSQQILTVRSTNSTVSFVSLRPSPDFVLSQFSQFFEIRISKKLSVTVI